MPFEVLAAVCGRITKEASPIRIVRLKTNCGQAKSMIACTNGSFVALSKSLRQAAIPAPRFALPTFLLGMECPGRNRLGSANASRVRKHRIELGFSQVPVPHPVQTALSNARISRFARDQITEDMALCHPKKGEVGRILLPSALRRDRIPSSVRLAPRYLCIVADRSRMITDVLRSRSYSVKLPEK